MTSGEHNSPKSAPHQSNSQRSQKTAPLCVHDEVTCFNRTVYLHLHSGGIGHFVSHRRGDIFSATDRRLITLVAAIQASAGALRKGLFPAPRGRQGTRKRRYGNARARHAISGRWQVRSAGVWIPLRHHKGAGLHGYSGRTSHQRCPDPQGEDRARVRIHAGGR